MSSKETKFKKEFLSRYYTNWDPKKFNWKIGSSDIAMIYSKYFEIWWDPKLFNWDCGGIIHASWALSEHCHRYIKIWWNAEKFNWGGYSWSLARYCHKDFNLWYKPEKLNWVGIIQNDKTVPPTDELVEYCSKYKSIWEKEWIIHKLSL